MENIPMPLDAYGKPMEFTPFLKWLGGYDFDAEDEAAKENQTARESSL